MTDKPKPCPRCGCTVSDAVTYIFIPAENLRWHSMCWDEARRSSEDLKEEKAQ